MSIAAHRAWRSVGVRAVLFLLGGFAALFWPAVTLPALVIAFGVFAVADGLVALFGALRAGTGGRPWATRFLEGLVGAGLGVVVLGWPGLSPAVLLYLIAAWALVTGVLEIAASFRVREQLGGEWTLALAGVLSVLLGLSLALRPAGNALDVLWLIGLYAILVGGLGLLSSRRLRRRAGRAPADAASGDRDDETARPEPDRGRTDERGRRPSLWRVVLGGIKIVLLVGLGLVLLQPFAERSRTEQQRSELLDQFQAERGSRVVTMIHRAETMSVLGVPVSRSIGIRDSEEILRAIRLTESGRPIDLILHTPGGLVLASEQVARALRRHEGQVTVFVPHYAMSGGTLMALAADSIVMDPNAVLGPVDPQIGGMPAASILRVTQVKPPEAMSDPMIVMADVAEKARRQVRDFVAELLSDRMSEGEALKLATTLSRGQWTHDYAITLDRARELGLPVSTDMPRLVYQLMDLYQQTGEGRPSVMYVPLRDPPGLVGEEGAGAGGGPSTP